MARLNRWCLATCLATMLMLASSNCVQAQPKATSNRKVRENAIQSIPFDQMTPESRTRIASVVKKPSIYRRMPLQVIHSDPDMYLFLVRYPEVVINIWRLMGISECTTRRVGQYTISGNDGIGTTCSVELVYGTADTHIIYAEGFYEGGLFKKKIKGRCVLVLRSGYAQDNDQRTVVTNQLDMFLQIDNVGLDILAKTLQPLVNQSADYNFTQSAQFVGRVSKLAEENGAGVQRLAGKLRDVNPTVRARFAELAAIVSHRAALRDETIGQVIPNNAPQISQNSR